MQFSGSLGESSQKTRSGLIGFAEFMARASRTFTAFLKPSEN
jgi:hypothetical protein